MTPRPFFALRAPLLLLAAAITAAAQVPSSAPATATTNSEPRTFALRSLSEGSAGAEAVDIAVYRNALRLAPNDAGLYNNLGYAYARQQNDPRLLGYLCTTWGKVKIPQAAEWPPAKDVLTEWK